MDWSLLQHSSNDYEDSATTIAFTSNVTKESLLLVWHNASGTGVPRDGLPTDSRGNQWREAAGIYTANDQDVRLWWAQAKDAGACTVTFPFTAIFATGRGFAEIAPPIPGASIVQDGTGQNAHVDVGAGTDIGTLGPATVARDSSFAVTILGTDGGSTPSITAGTGWTLDESHDLGSSASNDRIAMAHQQVDAGSVTAKWSNTTQGIVAGLLLAVFAIRPPDEDTGTIIRPMRMI